MLWLAENGFIIPGRRCYSDAINGRHSDVINGCHSDVIN